MKSVYLLTGKPGTGKTSLIKQVISGMKGEPGGFYTEEIRSQGVRQGFSLVTLDGREVVLAHVNIRSPYRVSKYGVDIDSFDRVGVSALHLATQQSDLVIIDEIGKMELFSDDFSGKRILGTIMLNPDPWVDAIKGLPQVNLVTVTRTNNQDVLEKLRHWLEVIK
jgi:nucleoside-triphosphatase